MSIKIKNILMNSAYQLFAMLFPIMTMPIVARTFSPDVLSKYSFTYSIAYIFLLLAKLGIDNYGVREIATADEKEVPFLFWRIYTVQFLMGGISLVIYLLIVTLCLSGDIKLIAYIQIFWIISGMLDISWLFIGKKYMKIVIIRNFSIKFLILIGIFFLSFSNLNIYVYTAIMAGGNLIGSLINWLSLYKFVGINSFKILYKSKKAGNSPQIWLGLLKLFVPIMAITVYTQFDSILIGNILTISVVSLYQYAVAIINLPKSVIGAIGTVMLPEMSTKSNASKELNIIVTLKLIVAFSSASALFIILFGKRIVLILLGSNFVQTGELISIFAISLVFFGIGNVIRTQILIPNKLDSIYLKSFILGAIVNLASNLILIKYLGIMGAIYAQVITDITITMYSFYFLENKQIFKYIVSELCVSGIFILFGLMIAEENNVMLNIIVLLSFLLSIFLILLGNRTKRTQIMQFLKK